MFSTRLKELRKKAALTQVEFAKKINVANGTVGNWESGNRQPDHEMLTKLADFFDVSVDYLLGRTDDPHQKPGEENIKFDEFTYAMYNESKELTEEDKQALLGMARLLKSKIKDNKG